MGKTRHFDFIVLVFNDIKSIREVVNDKITVSFDGVKFLNFA